MNPDGPPLARSTAVEDVEDAEDEDGEEDEQPASTPEAARPALATAASGR